MNFDEYGTFDATGLAELVKSKTVSPAELAQTAIEAVDRLNPDLNCVIETFAPEAPAGMDAPFTGVPTLIKDFPMVKGQRAEMGSQLAEGFIATADSNLWTRLRAAGFVNIGRSTTSEFGINATTECRISGATRNPWNLSRSVAGSSGGAAAAVSAGLVPVAHGSDGGGSIRTPASFCGLVGLKPSRGRVSGAPGLVSGLGGISYNFMLTRTVRDCAGLLDVLSGPCPGDFIELQNPPILFAQALETPLSGTLKIGFASQSWSETSIQPDVARALGKVATTCELMGHTVEEIAAPFNYQEFFHAQSELWAVNTRVTVLELAALLGRVPSSENLQTTTMALFHAGAEIAGDKYAAALRFLGRMARQIAEVFEKYDALLTPTALIVPDRIGAVDFDLPDATLHDIYKQLEPKETFTAPFNISGHPAISLPLALSAEGLPIGAQFIAHAGNDQLLLQIAKTFEESELWVKERPATHCCHLSSKELA